MASVRTRTIHPLPARELQPLLTLYAHCSGVSWPSLRQSAAFGVCEFDLCVFLPQTHACAFFEHWKAMYTHHARRPPQLPNWACRVEDYWLGYKYFCYAYYSHSFEHESDFRQSKLGSCFQPTIYFSPVHVGFLCLATFMFVGVVSTSNGLHNFV